MLQNLIEFLTDALKVVTWSRLLEEVEQFDKLFFGPGLNRLCVNIFGIIIGVQCEAFFSSEVFLEIEFVENTTLFNKIFI